MDDGNFSSTQAEPYITEPGTYQLTVIDNTTGCEAVGWVDVGNCAFITENFDIAVSNSCGGPNTGSVSVGIPNGLGAAPYLFRWYKKIGNTKLFLEEQASADGAALLDGLGAGEYCFHVLSANGCEIEKCGYTVSEFLPPTIAADIVPEAQPGSADGSISLTATGGWQGEIKYLWSNGADSQPVNEHLAAGTYTVTVEFGNGECSNVYTYEVHTCDQLVGTFAPFTVVYGETPTSPAYIDLTITNLPGYDFNVEWTSQDDPGFHANTEDIYPEADGQYCYTISHPICPAEDAQCDDLCDFTISFSTDPDPANGCGHVQLTANVTETGQPLNYAWNTGEGTEGIVAAFGQTYCVTITNGEGCDAVACFTPTVVPLSLDFGTLNATFGNSNGSATVSVQGGSPPYSYIWTNGAETASIGQLAPGEYCVTVMDYCGAVATGCVAVQCEFGTNILSAVIVPVNCATDGKGRIDLSITQQGLNITKYDWSNGSKVEDQTGLVAGEYCVTVTDASGCTATGCYTVPGGVGGFPVDFNLDGGCLGSNNGTITALPQNNNGPYTYNWSAWTASSIGGLPFSASTQTITELEAGWYFVTVTNALGCSSTDWTFLWEKPKFEVKATATPNPVCHDGGSAQGDVAIIGGTPPGLLVYTWYHGVTQTEIVTPNSHVEGLVPGAWAVSVTDGEGCIWPTGVLVEQYDEIVPDFVVCPDAYTWTEGQGQIYVLPPSGGVPPFQFDWSNGNGTGSWESGRNDVNVGSYSVTVTDSKGCTAIQALNVEEIPGGIGEDDIIVTGTVTAADCTCCEVGGAIHLSIQNLDISPYYLRHYYIGQSWAQPEGQILGPFTGTEIDIYDLPIGVNNLFQITLTPDNYGEAAIPYCWTSQYYGDFVVLPSDPVEITVENISSVPPVIDISVAGGLMPYTYQWSNGKTTQDINGMPPGTYTVSVTDAQGCTASSVFEICGQAPPIIADLSGLPIPVVPCTSGEQDGVVLAPGISGGTPPFEYAWTGPNGFQSSSADLTGLGTPGEYCLTVSDACHAEFEICRNLVCDCEDIWFSFYTDDCTRGDDGWVDVHTIGYSGDQNYYILWNESGVEELSEVYVDENGQVEDVISGYNKKTVPTGETPLICISVIHPQTYCRSEQKCVSMWGEHDCFYIFERPRPDVENDEQLLEILNTTFPAYEGNFINRCGQGDHCENPQEDYKTERLSYRPYDCNNICRGGGIITCDGCAGVGPVSDGTKHMSVPVNYAGHFIEETDGEDKCYCLFPPGLIDDSDFDFLMERTIITKAQENSWTPFTDFRYPLDPISAGIVAEVRCNGCEEVEPDPDSGIPSSPGPPDGPNCDDLVDCGEADCLVTPNPADCSYLIACSDAPSVVLDEVPVELDIVWIDIGTDCPFEDPSYCNLLLMNQCPINPCYPSFQEANVFLFTEAGVAEWDISFHFGIDEDELDCGNDDFCDGEEIRQLFDAAHECHDFNPLVGNFGNTHPGTTGLPDSLSSGNLLGARVFPNPFANDLAIQVWSMQEGPGKVVVLNSLGEIKSQMEVQVGEGLSTFRWVPDENTPTGLYHIVVTMENGAQATVKAVYLK